MALLFPCIWVLAIVVHYYGERSQTRTMNRPLLTPQNTTLASIHSIALTLFTNFPSVSPAHGHYSLLYCYFFPIAIPLTFSPTVDSSPSTPAQTRISCTFVTHFLGSWPFSCLVLWHWQVRATSNVAMKGSSGCWCRWNIVSAVGWWKAGVEVRGRGTGWGKGWGQGWRTTTAKGGCWCYLAWWGCVAIVYLMLLY